MNATWLTFIIHKLHYSVGTSLAVISEKTLLITLFSILLSEQQAAQMSNFGRKHYWCLASIQYKIQEDRLY